ncbi:adenylyl-sulfate kinase [Kangiella koreensis]|uniref:Adenylyl-sulfate kinase n=1 Tax=Kangiella koreensis (strain DSM 16069 / JCM 12317 / KCTC 12182 / SW-125) TaxID=523791 RepID=C7RAR4_KANKD|nr:adenylyl-sulfate kinase [Kangiella koreensis]ACV26356.1 adenylylsulfate kinase [Kangiella koreensis DSM 16069]
MTENIVWHHHNVTHEDRCQQKNQKPCVLWFTGLSGSGKSTVANAVESLLFQNGNHSYLLDGDNVRHGLNQDLSFSEEDRVENIRRIGEVTKLFADSGLIVLSAFISPFQADRQQVRDLHNEGDFIEVFVDTPLEVCEQRDPKGLYKKARAGDIKNFTGLDSPYEAPNNPEIQLKSDEHTIDELANQVLDYLRNNGFIS